MKRIFRALSVLACATTVGLVGCGDDDDGGGGGGTAGKAGNEPVAGNGNEPVAGAPGNGGPNVGCDAKADTTCQNPTDCAFVVDGSARRSAQLCGKEQCLGSTDEDCARDCILESRDMTSECAACYADVVNCTIAKCLGECVEDAESEGCLACQVEQGCRGAFNDCSGLPE